MPRPRQIRDPVRLRIEIDRTLHRRLIERCGKQTLRDGRVVPLTELVRQLLGEAVPENDKQN